ncbi:hypothetical protein IWW38_004359, partial [Coemansia aciculifera]
MSRSYSTRIDAPVVDALSGLERGRVRGSLAVLPLRSNDSTAAGARCSVIVHVGSLHGVSEAEMTSVHCRLRLVTKSGTGDAVTSPPLSGFGDGPVNVNFRQQWTICNDEDAAGAAVSLVVDFFGAAQPLALRRAFHEDVQLEQSLRNAAATGSSSLTKSASSSQLLVERLHEEELLVDSQHELVVWFRVLELGQDGQWERAPCNQSSSTLGSPVFLLRQGVQRRLRLCLSHNASQHLRITRISTVKVGRPQLVDEKGRNVNSHSSSSSQAAAAAAAAAMLVPLSVIDVRLDDGGRLDNRCFVHATMAWDTSVYGSALLDMPTADCRSMCVRLALSLGLEIENGEAPVVLETEIFAQVHSRQAAIAPRFTSRSSWLVSLLTDNPITRSGSGPATSTTTTISPSPPVKDDGEEFAPLVDPVFRVFSVTLSPVNPGLGVGRSELWRLNTGKQYVRGEETLLPWQPRCIRYVDEFHRLEYIETWRLLVARTRAQIEAAGPLPICSEDVEAVRRSLADPETVAADTRLLSLRQERIRRRVLEAVRKISVFRCVPDNGSLGLHQDPLQSSVQSFGGESTSETATTLDTTSRLATALVIRRFYRPCNIRAVTMQGGHFCYHGWVDILDTNDTEAGEGGDQRWSGRWLVVERPFIFVYTSEACVFLENIINIVSARISIDQHVAEMLGRKGLLAL